MDVETAEAVDTLRADIRRAEREVVRVETSLTAKIDQVESSLTATMRELNEEAKRHTDVRIEDVRDDIRILAEGFASLSATVESLRR
jgi:phage host-nuclease inhibitor protein Gam